MLTLTLIVAVCFVAFTNGANANFKGVATLYGSGTTSLRGALIWGTATTFAGSLAAVYFAGGLLKSFSGRGIVSDELAQLPQFAASVAIGGAVTSFIATRFGFPVSTTHALVGGLFGAGVASDWSELKWAALANSLAVPLFVSPLIAIVIGAFLQRSVAVFGKGVGRPVRALNSFHFACCGAASFARGLNDTPKMAALLLLAPGFNATLSMLLVAIFIVFGAWIDASRVAETLGRKVTDMNAEEGLIASFVTAGLVTTANFHSMPVSTTHVSVGSLVGIGAANGQAKWSKATEIFAAWLSTAPVAATISFLIFLFLFRG